MADYPDLISLLQEVMRGVDVDNSKSLNYNEFIAATLSRNTVGTNPCYQPQSDSFNFPSPVASLLSCFYRQHSPL